MAILDIYHIFAAMNKKEFIKDYIDELFILDVAEKFGPDVDSIDDDTFKQIINSSCDKALDEYTDEDGNLIEDDINFSYLREDTMRNISKLLYNEK